jgi:hypothetical protein
VPGDPQAPAYYRDADPVRVTMSIMHGTVRRTTLALLAFIVPSGLPPTSSLHAQLPRLAALDSMRAAGAAAASDRMRVQRAAASFRLDGGKLVARRSGPPHRAQATVASPRIEFTDPPFDIPMELRDSIRFGWLTVPQDHDDPTAGSIRLAVSIVAARTSEPLPDPIVLVPGGPGDGHVATGSVFVARSLRVALHRQRRSVVLLDPRGAGLSQPETCPELNGSEPLDSGDVEAERILIATLEACRERLGVRLQSATLLPARAMGPGRRDRLDRARQARGPGARRRGSDTEHQRHPPYVTRDQGRRSDRCHWSVSGDRHRGVVGIAWVHTHRVQEDGE